jgi:hypothetical protein
MREELFLRLDPEQIVQQSAVPHVYFGRFDLTFADVCEPGLKLSNRECVGEQVEIAPRLPASIVAPMKALNPAAAESRPGAR